MRYDRFPGHLPACWSHAVIEGGFTVWFVLVHLVGFLVGLLTPTRRPDHDQRVLTSASASPMEARPHHGLSQRPPVPSPPPAHPGPIRCRNLLGGLLRSYD